MEILTRWSGESYLSTVRSGGEGAGQVDETCSVQSSAVRVKAVNVSAAKSVCPGGETLLLFQWYVAYEVFRPPCLFEGGSLVEQGTINYIWN